VGGSATDQLVQRTSSPIEQTPRCNHPWRNSLHCLVEHEKAGFGVCCFSIAVTMGERPSVAGGWGKNYSRGVGLGKEGVSGQVTTGGRQNRGGLGRKVGW